MVADFEINTSMTVGSERLILDWFLGHSRKCVASAVTGVVRSSPGEMQGRRQLLLQGKFSNAL